MNNIPKQILGRPIKTDDVVILLDEGAVVPVFVASTVRLIIRNYDYSERSNKETIHEDVISLGGKTLQDDSGRLYVETVYEGRRKLL